jgi:hypothetical protein
MRFSHLIPVVPVAVLALLAPAVTLIVSDPAAGAKVEQAAPGGSLPKYNFPKRGNPGARLGGGARGISKEFTLAALAPDHVGLTLRERPALYWYVSKATPYPVVFTLVDADADKPVVEARLKPTAEHGVQRIRLADHGVALAPGVHYQWFVALAVDPGHPSSDIIAGGVIERIEPNKDLSSKLAGAKGADAPRLYAEAGLWYDALETVSELIDAGGANEGFRKHRAALLQQVGLSEIAAYDLRDGAAHPH